MLRDLQPGKVLFLDIETIPAESSYDHLSEVMKAQWDKKGQYFCKEGEVPSDLYHRSGIYAEFGRIVCVSVGFLVMHSGKFNLRIKSFYGKNEKLLLEEFAELLHKHFNTQNHLLCAHNGKEFDFPYICRRMLVNGIKLPDILNIAGKKPWEIRHLDTMELWKFGDYKHFTSISLLTAIFNIPTPKDDIDGSQVWRVYWEEDDLERIKTYCQKDVLAVVQLMMRYLGEPLLNPEHVEYQ